MVLRLIKWGVLFGLVLGLVAVVWAFATVRIDRPVEYTDITEHFKYGSIGSEPGGSLLAPVGGVLPPYQVFKTLPSICSDRLPGGYASVGLIVEPGHDLPVGVSRRRRLGIDQVGFNAPLCHTAPSATLRPPSPRGARDAAHQLDLESLVRFVLDCSLDSRTTRRTERTIRGDGDAPLFER
jgi:hypothetical protein